MFLTCYFSCSGLTHCLWIARIARETRDKGEKSIFLKQLCWLSSYINIMLLTVVNSGH